MITGIINTKSLLPVEYRFDPDIHLSEGVKVRRVIDSLPYEISSIGENSERVFYGNIFSRIFVKKPEFGVEYLAASDTVLSNLNTGRYLSKKQAEQLSYLKIKKDWILVTCSGTLGNVIYTNRIFEDKIATHDLIRIVPNDYKVKRGVLYAFLSGKFGYNQITQSQFGGVVKHINEKQTKCIKVPVFPSDFQKQVDDLIQESALLREEAQDTLDEAQAKVESILAIPGVLPTPSVTIKNIINSHNNRFEGSYYISENRSLFDYVTTNYNCKTLKDYTERIFRPGIFKREYVKNGVTFLGGADIMMAIPKSDKQLSFRQVAKMSELKVKKGWMLVTCGGTIGNTVYIDKQIEQCVVSQHVMRIIPKQDILPGFLYAYLSSRIGYKLITLFTYGAVIQSVEPHHLELVPIPDFKKEDMQSIDCMVQEYVTKIEIAKEKELKAITLVEQEIEKWNK